MHASQCNLLRRELHCGAINAKQLQMRSGLISSNFFSCRIKVQSNHKISKPIQRHGEEPRLVAILERRSHLDTLSAWRLVGLLRHISKAVVIFEIHIV